MNYYTMTGRVLSALLLGAASVGFAIGWCAR
jgi:hypothetical protein